MPRSPPSSACGAGCQSLKLHLQSNTEKSCFIYSCLIFLNALLLRMGKLLRWPLGSVPGKEQSTAQAPSQHLGRVSGGDADT